MKLTEREQETLSYIKEYMKNNGTIPTMADIGRGINASTKVAHDYFHILVNKGYVKQITDKRYVVKGMIYVER